MWNPKICKDPATWGQDDLVLLWDFSPLKQTALMGIFNGTFSYSGNFWVAKKDTKRSSVLLLRLLSFFATQTLIEKVKLVIWKKFIKKNGPTCQLWTFVVNQRHYYLWWNLTIVYLISSFRSPSRLSVRWRSSIQPKTKCKIGDKCQRRSGWISSQIRPRVSIWQGERWKE